MLELEAPAKVNLSLEVICRRPDGYHEVRSILASVSLADRLTFRESPVLKLHCDLPSWSAEKSLVRRAVHLVGEATGKQSGVEITLKKRIPLRAGLGGDSSDAAAVLRGLNRLWGLRLDGEKLFSLAASLGSDVPFFIRGGVALASGRGDKLEFLPSLPRMFLVLVLPQVSVPEEKTGAMYRSLRAEHFTDGTFTERLRQAIIGGKMLHPGLFFNVFEEIAFDVYQGLDACREHLIKLGAGRVHLAGSGPALFVVFSRKAEASGFYRTVTARGMQAYLAETV